MNDQWIQRVKTSFGHFSEGLCQMQQSEFLCLRWNAQKHKGVVFSYTFNIWQRFYHPAAPGYVRACVRARAWERDPLRHQTCFIPSHPHPPLSLLSLCVCNVLNSLLLSGSRVVIKPSKTPTCLHVCRLLLQRFARSSKNQHRERYCTIMSSLQPVLLGRKWIKKTAICNNQIIKFIKYLKRPRRLFPFCSVRNFMASS